MTMDALSASALGRLHPTGGHPERQERIDVLLASVPAEECRARRRRGRPAPLPHRRARGARPRHDDHDLARRRHRLHRVELGSGDARGGDRAGGRRPRRLRARAPARPPRARRARDGLLPVQQRRRRGPLRAGRARAGARRRSSTGTSTTATARRRSSGATRASSSSRSTSGRSTPARAGRTSRARRRSTPAPGRAAATRSTSSSSRRRSSRSCGASSPTCCSSSAGFDAHVEDPLADIERQRGRVPRARPPLRGARPARRRRARGRLQPGHAAGARGGRAGGVWVGKRSPTPSGSATAVRRVTHRGG